MRNLLGKEALLQYLPLLLIRKVADMEHIWLDFLPVLSQRPDWLGRCANCDAIRGYVSGYHRAGADYAVVPNADARHNDAVHADEHVVSNSNWAENVNVRVFVTKDPYTAVMRNKTCACSYRNVPSQPYQIWLGTKGCGRHAKDATVLADRDPNRAGIAYRIAMDLPETKEVLE